VCEPALKLLSVTTNGKQCGPHNASAPSDKCTVGVGGGGPAAVLLGGLDVECDVVGCGVGAGRVDNGCVDGDADLLRCAEVDAVGDGVRVLVAEPDTEADVVGPVSWPRV